VFILPAAAHLPWSLADQGQDTSEEKVQNTDEDYKVSALDKPQ